MPHISDTACSRPKYATYFRTWPPSRMNAYLRGRNPSAYCRGFLLLFGCPRISPILPVARQSIRRCSAWCSVATFAVSIAEFLYDRPGFNKLTGKPTVTNYRAVIQAVARRYNARFVVDGDHRLLANDLGLTTAVPAKIEVLVDSR